MNAVDLNLELPKSEATRATRAIVRHVPMLEARFPHAPLVWHSLPRSGAAKNPLRLEPRFNLAYNPSMSEPVLLSHLELGVLTLTMNRPESLNAGNEELLSALSAALSTAERDDAVRCIVVTGAGRGFCSGADLKAGIRGSLKEHLDRTFRPVVSKMRRSEERRVGKEC